MKKFVDKHVKKAKYKYYDKYFKEHSTNGKMQWRLLNELLNRSKENKNNFTMIKDTDNNTQYTITNC